MSFFSPDFLFLCLNDSPLCIDTVDKCIKSPVLSTCRVEHRYRFSLSLPLAFFFSCVREHSFRISPIFILIDRPQRGDRETAHSKHQSCPSKRTFTYCFNVYLDLFLSPFLCGVRARPRSLSFLPIENVPEYLFIINPGSLTRSIFWLNVISTEATACALDQLMDHIPYWIPPWHHYYLRSVMYQP